MDERPIYLDNHATTRVDPGVVEAMRPWFEEDYGNAHSVHVFGERARAAVEAAAASIAGAIGVEPGELVFTSGATESNNLALRGVVSRTRRRGDHLVSVATEHPSVLEPLQRLAKLGCEVSLVEVAQRGSPEAGRVDPQAVAGAITDHTCLVSVMLANNEIGVVQPIAEIAAICRERGVLLHTDATQAVGKLRVDAAELGVDLMSFSAHKLHGPKGVGALYVRGRDPIVRFEPQIVGGGQQRGRRSGTLNVPGIVGFAKALELSQKNYELMTRRTAGMRKRLFTLLRDGISDIELCGPDLDKNDDSGNPLRLSENLNVHVPGVDGEAVLMRCPDLGASSSAACSSADAEPSHVLRALSYSVDEARCALRFGLSRFTTAEEVERAAVQVVASIESLRHS